ncbi:major facilitator superfamily domain-containing protein [Xylaria cf. heliscus]|nr:major facilitator superfamily domain-containing protein [Xylaria cf. heliscus]
MSVTLSVYRSDPMLSGPFKKRVRERSKASEHGTQKPDLVSLNNFASKIRSIRLLDSNHENAGLFNNATVLNTENTRAEASLQFSSEVIDKSSCLAKSTVEGANSEHTEHITLKNQEVTNSKHLIARKDDSLNIERRIDGIVSSNLREQALDRPSVGLTSIPSAINEDRIRSSTVYESDSKVSEGSSLSARKQTNDQHSLKRVPNDLSGGSGPPLEAKEPTRCNSWEPDQIHIPRTRWERLRGITLASPTTLKIEDAEFSPASREKLRNFSKMLASTKCQIELFGKELPLFRVSLVQVREGNTAPDTYICIQGLKNAADITRIHAALSHKRYKQLYSPLKLCYETSDLVHVTFPDNESTIPSQNTASRSGASCAPTAVDAVPIPRETPADISPVEPDSHVLGVYQYLPKLGGRTYCGTLCKTCVDGQDFVSTLGGLLEVNGTMYLMTCHHGFRRPPAESTPPLSDIQLEDYPAMPSECPLVFCSDELPDSSENAEHGETSPIQSRLATSVSGALEWTDLSISGSVSMGQEWVMIPIHKNSILPNLIEKPNTGETFYLDDLQKGDSGSWVLDTSDPLQYQVLGPVIAASHGAAHFIPLPKQFHERMALAPAFPTLVHCAHVASCSNDPISNVLINEAFTPRTLQQLRTGWYLPVIKTIIGVYNSRTTELPTFDPWSQVRIESLKALFLRYGTELLDNIHDKRWVQERSKELRQHESQVLEQFAAIAKPLYKTQHDKRRTEVLNSCHVGDHIEASGVEEPLGFWVIILSVCLLYVSVGINSTILTNALPTIIRSVDIGNHYIWLQVTPELAALFTRLLINQHTQVSGRRLFPVIVAIFFVLGSSIAGNATNAAMLISGRVVYGLGVGGFHAFSEIAVLHLVPTDKDKANTCRASLQFFYEVGIISGPIIGGVIVGVDWRWCFYLQLIIGGLALICMLLFWNPKHTARPSASTWTVFILHLILAIILQGSTVSVLIGLVFGGVRFPWRSAHVITPIIVGGLGWITSAIYMFTYSFTNGTLVAGCLTLFSSQALLSSVTWMLPIYFMGVTAVSPLTSSVNQLPLSLVILVVKSVTAAIYSLQTTKTLLIGRKKRNKLPQHLVGFVLAGLGVGLFAILGPQTSAVTWVVIQGISALGLGSLFVTLWSAIQANIRAEETAEVIDTCMHFASFGAISGTTISSVIFNNQVNGFLYRIGEIQVRKELANGNAYGFASPTGVQQLPSEIKTSVVAIYTDSLKTVSLVAIGFAGLGIIAGFFLGVDTRRRNACEGRGLEDNEAEKV